jgi:hypothetical protein
VTPTWSAHGFAGKDLRVLPGSDGTGVPAKAS